MLEPTAPLPEVPERVSLLPAAREACFQVPPLRGLRDWVAVNPWAGWSDRPLDQSLEEIREAGSGEVLPSLAWYRQALSRGKFRREHLERAAARRGCEAGPILAHLEPSVAQRDWRTPSSIAELAGLHEAMVRQAVSWCLRIHGGSPGPWTDGLYRSWREAQILERRIPARELGGWRDWMERSPPDSSGMLKETPAFLGERGWEARLWCLRLLNGTPGWAGWLRGREFLDGSVEGLLELLAIRACQERAIHDLVAGLPRSSHGDSTTDSVYRFILQEALEDAWMERFAVGVRSTRTPAPTPSAQAVFCIDVRSEVFRRSLETEAPEVTTTGFAGFFGLALDWRENGHSSDRCPALLRPSFRVEAPSRSSPGPGAANGTAANLPGVEVKGWLSAWPLLRSWWAHPPHEPGNPAERGGMVELRGPDGDPLDVGSRADLAQSLLRNMGLGEPAPLVVLVGHRGRSANNPLEASLHCGACGGNGGAANARAAAGLLSDPEVRRELARRGCAIPEGTLFLAAEHDTTLEEVTVLDRERIAPGRREEVGRLEAAFALAGDRSRKERARSLGLPSDWHSERLRSAFRARAMDPAEVRPEWGLAGNAAFLLGGRELSRGADLEGRVFLHEHRAECEGSEAVLEMALTAPVVVAAWINLQYLASSVDPGRLGAGSKNLHNRVGDVGILLGEGMDLQTGLPWQSIFAEDGTPRHEPLRLQVVVQDTRARLDGILVRRTEIGDLVRNGWIRLFAWEEGTFWRRLAKGWESFGEPDPVRSTAPAFLGSLQAVPSR